MNPQARLTAVKNNIHHTNYGVIFSRLCLPVEGCIGDRNPPLGELSENTFSHYRIGVLVESGRPAISDLNNFMAGDTERWITLLNTSGHTIADPRNPLNPLRFLNALNNTWPIPIRAENSILSTSADTYYHTSGDGSTLAYSTIVNDPRNPKNIVNIGGPGATVERRPQTFAGGGCSLVRDDS